MALKSISQLQNTSVVKVESDKLLLSRKRDQAEQEYISYNADLSLIQKALLSSLEKDYVTLRTPQTVSVTKHWAADQRFLEDVEVDQDVLINNGLSVGGTTSFSGKLGWVEGSGIEHYEGINIKSTRLENDTDSHSMQVLFRDKNGKPAGALEVNQTPDVRDVVINTVISSGIDGQQNAGLSVGVTRQTKIPYAFAPDPQQISVTLPLSSSDYVATTKYVNTISAQLSSEMRNDDDMRYVQKIDLLNKTAGEWKNPSTTTAGSNHGRKVITFIEIKDGNIISSQTMTMLSNVADYFGAIDFYDTEVPGYYVSKVDQNDGKIAVYRKQLPVFLDWVLRSEIGTAAKKNEEYFAKADHIHDDRYYTEAEIDDMLGSVGGMKYSGNLLINASTYTTDTIPVPLITLEHDAIITVTADAKTGCSANVKNDPRSVLVNDDVLIDIFSLKYPKKQTTTVLLKQGDTVYARGAGCKNHGINVTINGSYLTRK